MIRGIAAGALTLLAIHALVARANQSQLSGLVGTFTSLVDHFLDPNRPAIPDRSTN